MIDMDEVLHSSSWWLLLASVWCAWFTWNAFRPIRGVRELIVGSFLVGWWTSELPLHQLAWQVFGAFVLVQLGALHDWPGVLGLAISVVSWAALIFLAITATRSGEIFERALSKDLGEQYAETFSEEIRRHALTAESRRRLLVPFYFRDRRVRVHGGIQYAEGAGRRHQLDVHVPIHTVKGAPVLFQVHGGGWIVGHKRQQGMPLVNHMAARGWVCVSANYRLSPRATFPDHLIDLKQALAWTRQNIAKYGGDPNFIVVTGGSAGGHLCTLLALTPNDPRYQPGFEDVDTRVQACVPFYAVYDLVDRHRVHMHRGLALLVNRVFMKSSPSRDPEAFERASPIARINPEAPPFFIVHGTHDSLAPHEEARVFVDALRKVSKEKVIYVELPGVQHAFEVFHSIRTGHATAAVFRFLSTVHANYLSKQGAGAHDADRSVHSTGDLAERATSSSSG